MPPQIVVEGLSKTYRVPVKPPGLLGSLRALVAREYKEVRAVQEVSFQIEAGERVGFLGPNGAGKTTTLKMLSGLLHPTAGRVSVAGFTPQSRQPAFLETITLVMGQKQQLLWDLPPRETLELNRALFGVRRDDFLQVMKDLEDLLGLGALLDKPTRNLSLGERMRCELAAALVHRPRVLFLDEPTIGLDVTAQIQIREFIQLASRRYGATVLLTSHYMQDIAALTPRLLIIDRGQLRYDGSLSALVARFAPERRVVVKGSPSPEIAAALAGLGFAARNEGGEPEQVAQVPVEAVNPLVQRVLAAWPQGMFSVEEVPLEEVVRRAFEEAA